MVYPKAALIMGSKSDYEALTPCIKTFAEFGVQLDVHVMSAHRTPHEATNFAADARKNGYGVLLAAAGMAAHLPGVLAAFTTLPIVGIPMKSSFNDGLDSLLSIVMMPPGIPVATVGVSAAANAALLALQILQGAHPELTAKLDAHRAAQAEAVRKADAEIQ